MKVNERLLSKERDKMIADAVKRERKQRRDRNKNKLRSNDEKNS